MSAGVERRVDRSGPVLFRYVGKFESFGDVEEGRDQDEYVTI